MPRDAIVLQFGSYANFVSSHFWNCQVCICSCIFCGSCCFQRCMCALQEAERKAAVSSIDASVLYRENASRQFPRALIFDVRGSLGGVPLVGDEPAGDAERPVNQSTWPGFCDSRFHSKSLHQVGVAHSTSSMDNFPGGVGWAGMDADERDVLEDGLRWHLEDSDYVQVRCCSVALQNPAHCMIFVFTSSYRGCALCCAGFHGRRQHARWLWWLFP